MYSTLKLIDAAKRQLIVNPSYTYPEARKTITVGDGAAITINGQVARFEDLQPGDWLETTGELPCVKVEAQRISEEE